MRFNYLISVDVEVLTAGSERFKRETGEDAVLRAIARHTDPERFEIEDCHVVDSQPLGLDR